MVAAAELSRISTRVMMQGGWGGKQSNPRGGDLTLRAPSCRTWRAPACQTGRAQTSAFCGGDDDTMSKEKKKGETEMEERKRVNFSPFLGTAEKGALLRFR